MVSVGTTVRTPFGPGVVRRFRPRDGVFEVILTGWLAMAFVQEASCVRVEEEGLWTKGKAYFAKLRFPVLFGVTAVLFVLDFFTPDLIPFADELLLGLATALFARWTARSSQRLTAQRQTPPERSAAGP